MAPPALFFHTPSIRAHGGCKERVQVIVPNYPSWTFSPHISYLVSDEKFVLDGEGGWVGGTEPPRRPEDGGPRAEPLLAVFSDEGHNQVPVPLDALAGEVQDLPGREMAESRCPDQVMTADQVQRELIQGIYSHLDVNSGSSSWQ